MSNGKVFGDFFSCTYLGISWEFCVFWGVSVVFSFSNKSAKPSLSMWSLWPNQMPPKCFLVRPDINNHLMQNQEYLERFFGTSCPGATDPLTRALSASKMLKVTFAYGQLAARARFSSCFRWRCSKNMPGRFLMLFIACKDLIRHFLQNKKIINSHKTFHQLQNKHKPHFVPNYIQSGTYKSHVRCASRNEPHQNNICPAAEFVLL